MLFPLIWTAVLITFTVYYEIKIYRLKKGLGVHKRLMGNVLFFRSTRIYHAYLCCTIVGFLGLSSDEAFRLFGRNIDYFFVSMIGIAAILITNTLNVFIGEKGIIISGELLGWGEIVNITIDNNQINKKTCTIAFTLKDTRVINCYAQFENIQLYTEKGILPLNV